MKLCSHIHDVAKGRSLVLLCATWKEAAPIVEAVTIEADLSVAGKRILTGSLGDPTSGTGTPGMVLAVTGCDKANTAHALTCLLQAMDPLPRLVLQTGIAGAFIGAGSAADPETRARPGDLVLATEEAYSDTGSTGPEGWLSAEELSLPIASVDGRELGGRFTLDAGLVERAASVLTAEIESAEAADGGAAPFGAAGAAAAPLAGRRLVQGPFVTSSSVTGLRSDADRVQARWGAVAESMEGAAGAHICALYGVPFLEVRAVSNMVVDRERSSWVVDEAVAVAGAAAVALIRATSRLFECVNGDGDRYAGA